MAKKDFAQSANRLQATSDTGKENIIKELIQPATSSLQEKQGLELPVEERKTARVLLLTKPSTKAKITQLAKAQHSNFNDFVNRIMEAYIKQEQGKEE